MANISLYISGQTELGDLSEFFQKRLIGEGETPIAFFDGVFYESHQERVGNIVYQDYLIYTDKALYLWARGASKDFLDRFSLGAVSVNSRNKDSAFATVNLKIRREGKEPIYVIFDMVEIREADTIVKLQTLVESIIEDYLGINYRQEIPQDTADRIFQAARTICPPRQIALQLNTPQPPTPDAGIGYGQDLLEQYRASAGYEQPQMPYPPYQPPGTGGARPRSMGPQDAMRGLESMLPTDPASLKRIAEQIKNIVGDAPFKMRDQVMKDLQHVPGDMATVLTALNELLSNIAGNPMAERFVINAIKTAVVNDGVLGSLSKIIKMTGFGSGGGRKSPKSAATEPYHEDRGASRPRKSPIIEEPDEDTSTIRRKKISIKDDDDKSSADLFAGSDEPITSRESRSPVSRSSAPDDDDFGAESCGGRRKKLSIKAEEGSGAEADIARKLMSYDEASRGAVNSLLSSDEVQGSIADDDQTEPEPEKPVRKTIQIKAESEPEAVISTEFEIAYEPEPEPEVPVRKKIQIKAEVEPEAVVSTEPEAESESALEEVIVESISVEANVESEFEMLPQSKPEEPAIEEIRIESELEEEFDILEDVIFSALGEPEMAADASESEEYMTIESDSPAQKVVSEPVKELIKEPLIEKKNNLNSPGICPERPAAVNGAAKKSEGDEPEGDKYSV